jgi:hypothetical protein
MSTIKNIHLLELSDNDRVKLLAGAALHLRMSNISFKILEVTNTAITLRVIQGKHLSENYADKKALVELTKELFQRFYPDKKIHPQAIVFKHNPVMQITAQWVKEKMETLDLGVTDIVNDTGVDKTNISAWANGTRPMSQPVKAMFFHYFNSVAHQQKRVSALGIG